MIKIPAFIFACDDLGKFYLINDARSFFDRIDEGMLKETKSIENLNIFALLFVCMPTPNGQPFPFKVLETIILPWNKHHTIGFYLFVVLIFEPFAMLQFPRLLIRQIV